MSREFDWRKRAAMHIATLLPENPADAEIVLAHVRALAGFMESQPEKPTEEGQVLAFDRAAAILRPKS